MSIGYCRRRPPVLLVLLLSAAFAAAPAAAQIVIDTAPQTSGRTEGLRPSGLIVELGLAAPVHGDGGFLFGLNAPLGTFLSRHLDFSIGLRHWSADIDRSDLGAVTPGTFSDTSLDAVLTYPLLRIKGLRPYLGAGLAGHSVGADIPGDRSLEDALSGVNFGALTVLGVGTTKPGLGFRLQARRDFVDDVGAWTYTLGAGWWPKTRAAKARSRIQVGSHAAPTVVAPATPAPVAGGADPDLVTALNHLKAENAALAADLALLKRQVAEAAARESVADLRPAPLPAAVVPVEPEPDRADLLFDALTRAAARSGRSTALRREAGGMLLTLDQSLLFATGQSELNVGAREELRRLAVVLLRFPEARIVVQGHTDSMGQPVANQALSEQRAAAVRQELLAVGLRPDRLRAVGYGDTLPVAANDNAAGRARNRRVDLLITVPSSLSE